MTVQWPILLGSLNYVQDWSISWKVFCIPEGIWKTAFSDTTGTRHFGFVENWGKAPFFKCSPSTLKTRQPRLQIPPVRFQERFRKASFSWRISVDGRPDTRGVVGTGPGTWGHFVMPVTRRLPVIRWVYVHLRTYLSKRKIKWPVIINSARPFSAKFVSGQIILVVSVLA